MSKPYDVILVGGGIVGASLALILAKYSIKVALVEALSNEALAKLAQSERTIVLSHSSRMIFESVDIWSELQNNCCTINEIHVSDRGQFGTARLSADEERLPALGYVLTAGKIQSALMDAVHRQSNIQLIQPGRFISFIRENEQSFVTIEGSSAQQQILTGSLLVAADGQSSAVRSSQHIKTSQQDYQQVAIYCTVTLKRHHQHIAYERFTSTGPIALLPLSDQRSAVIWTVEQHRASSLVALSTSDFLRCLQEEFGYRLGKFIDCSQRYSAGLSLITAQQQIQPGMVLLGNAVHTLHPVAGQALNLGLRDVAVLAEQIVMAKRANKNIGSLEVLESYLSRREPDQRKIINITHNLVSIFSNNFLPIKLLRSKGLVLLDRMTGVKKMLTKTTSGVAGNVPRLVCGLDLEI